MTEFIVTTSVPEDFRFNGVVPFDMEIKDGEIAAKVYAVDFDEPITLVDIAPETENPEDTKPFNNPLVKCPSCGHEFDPKKTS